VLVEIDEAWGNDESGCVNDAFAREGLLADRDNLAVADANIADGVERGLWVDDAAVMKDDVVLGLGESSCAKKQKQRGDQNREPVLGHVGEW
jgi:hypothetical protein